MEHGERGARRAERGAPSAQSGLAAVPPESVKKRLCAQREPTGITTGPTGPLGVSQSSWAPGRT